MRALEDLGPRGIMINGKVAINDFLLIIDSELLTGKGLLEGTSILDFIYAVTNAFSS
jgi:hypothetical protein